MANGIVIIDKPAGWTSMDVCAKLRGILKEKRVGHAGTLDPMATGVLPVFVGRATRAVEFADKSNKIYVGGLRLGVVTNTQDTTGEVLENHPVNVTREQVEAVLANYRGDIEQIPPMFSAVKIGGKKLYELARKGKEVERKPRPVTIHRLEILEQVSETDYLVEIACSKGTYIRTLCHDIGGELGCGGALYSLQRTEAAGFVLADCVTIEDVQEQGESLLRPVSEYFKEHPITTVGEKEEKYIRNGASFKWEAEDGTYRVFGPEGNLLMLGQQEKGQMSTIKSFYDPR